MYMQQWNASRSTSCTATEGRVQVNVVNADRPRERQTSQEQPVSSERGPNDVLGAAASQLR